MRVVVLTMHGSCKVNDVIVVYYEAKRGGRTETAHFVREDESLADVAIGLAAGVNTNFCRPFFDARSQGAEVTIYVHDGADDVKFGWFCEHLVEGDHSKRALGGGIKMVITGDGIPTF